jgi:dTDP-4-dehydrorhamnose reductase
VTVVGAAGNSRIRALVTGGAGVLAGHLITAVPAGVELHLTEHSTPVDDARRRLAEVHRVDLRDGEATAALVDRVRPDVVIHTAYRQSERADVVDATDHVAAASAEVGAALVALSTDVVFAGDRPPYAETDPVDPVTDYGRWKVEAEQACVAAVSDACLVRVSLIVALDPPDRVTASLLDAIDAGERPTMFVDEWRQPASATDLATAIWAIVALDRPDRAGVWHLPGPEWCSRFELAVAIARATGRDPAAVAEAHQADHPSVRPQDPRLLTDRWHQLGITPRRVTEMRPA